jgi:hypothetical protein
VAMASLDRVRPVRILDDVKQRLLYVLCEDR